MIATEAEAKSEQTLHRQSESVFVLVPSYNHAEFIEATLRSIIKQTLQPAKLLVIDDGSSDDSPAIIERVLNDCPFPCEFAARDNRGLCATLNEGLERSVGEYFGYLGSDDVWLPDLLKARVQLLESRPNAVLAYGHTYIVDEANRIVDSTADWARYADGDAREMLLQTTAPMSPTVLYRRNALEHERWNEESNLEDYDLYLRLSNKGEFAFDPQILSAWRRHSSNVSWDQTLMLEEQLKAQRIAAQSFGLTAAEITRLQRTTRFNRAEDFLRLGQKSRALNLIVHNLLGANSVRTTARILLRLLIPNSLMRRRKLRRQQKNFRRYGSIRV